MSTVLATLSAASMRLGQPLSVDLSARLYDARILVSREDYPAWKEAIADADGMEVSDNPLLCVSYTSRDDDRWRITLGVLP